MHRFNVVIVDFSYMFLLLHSDHHQDVNQKWRKEIIIRLICGQDLFLKQHLGIL